MIPDNILDGLLAIPAEHLRRYLGGRGWQLEENRDRAGVWWVRKDGGPAALAVPSSGRPLDAWRSTYAALCAYHRLSPEQLLADLSLRGADEMYLTYDAELFSEQVSFDTVNDLIAAYAEAVEHVVAALGEQHGMTREALAEYQRQDVEIGLGHAGTVTLRFPHALGYDVERVGGDGPFGRQVVSILYRLLQEVGGYVEGGDNSAALFDEVPGYNETFNKLPIHSHLCRAVHKAITHVGSRCSVGFSWGLDVPSTAQLGWDPMVFASFKAAELLNAAKELSRHERAEASELEGTAASDTRTLGTYGRPARRRDVIPLLLDAGCLNDGAELLFRPGTEREKQALASWLAADPARGRARWTNADPTWRKPLVWEADERRYAPSQLVSTMMSQAGWQERPSGNRGTIRWALEGRETLVELADRIAAEAARNQK